MVSQYEAALVLSVSEGDDACSAVLEKIKALIAENGTLENVDDWGKRKLAYPIHDETEAAYYILDFSADVAFPAELDRVAKITEGVLRLMVTKK